LGSTMVSTWCGEDDRLESLDSALAEVYNVVATLLG
jgi:hypothetical protein